MESKGLEKISAPAVLFSPSIIIALVFFLRIRMSGVVIFVLC
jgi:hypothetical protein